jgi:mono/diheme cytochrome c family protein
MKTITVKFMLVLFTAFLMFFFAYGQEVAEWIVPDKYKEMKSPVDASDANLETGKMLYKKHCKSCHGDEGLGDGSKSETLESFCGDFSSDEFQAQSDGALYFKTTDGRDEMPSFKQKIADEDDRWCVVLYMRTFN